MEKLIYQNVTVNSDRELWGGGSSFGQEYISVVKEKLGKVHHICEFGAGPGYIGFSLLAHGLCDHLTLVDINQKAIELCKKTIQENHLEDRVTTYVSDCFDNVPSTEKFDLVVSNPPHFPSTDEEYKQDMKRYDPDLKIHKKYYSQLAAHLAPNGSSIFQERKLATTIFSFKQMIEENNLMITGVFDAKHSFIEFMKPVLQFKNPLRLFRKWRSYRFYFVWVKAKTNDYKPLNLFKLDLWN